ncbi:DeSI-like protein [Acrasis kona]|uniref:DeSI-like protein n=1 Tax=Acrasis kona TaxID=1008807 RepID=A0AAW2YKA8_9EUKA
MPKTNVILNVYDLNPNNNMTHAFGMGIYHSGLEVHGTEYTFGDGGAFSHDPRKAEGGAAFRESVILGETDLTSTQVKDIVYGLSKEFIKYHLTDKNCNHYSKELSIRILKKDVFPNWVNRMAWWGSKLGIAPGMETPSGPGAPSAQEPVNNFSAFQGGGRTLSGNAVQKEEEKSGGGFFGWFRGSEAPKTVTTTTTTTTTVMVPTDDRARREQILKATQARLAQQK